MNQATATAACKEHLHKVQSNPSLENIKALIDLFSESNDKDINRLYIALMKEIEKQSSDRAVLQAHRERTP